MRKFNTEGPVVAADHFPQSVALCGVRALLAQHTAETGQAFTPEALETVWTKTCGQPWLVNALCRRACFDAEAGRDRSRAIARGDLLDAQERLVLSRQTHLAQLADKLREDRVRRVVEPILSGRTESGFSDGDLRVRAGPRSGGAGPAVADRQSDLRGGVPPPADLPRRRGDRRVGDVKRRPPAQVPSGRRRTARPRRHPNRLVSRSYTSPRWPTATISTSNRRSRT